MAGAGGRIILENRFRQFNAEFDKALTVGLSRIGREVADDVRSGQTTYNIGTILQSADSTPVTKTARGYAVGVRSDDFRFIFFEKGTYSGRRGKLKRGGSKNTTRKGVKAGRFMFRALKARRERLNEYVAAELNLL